MQDNMRIIELTHTVQTKLLRLKKYNSKEEVLNIANNALNIINEDDTVSVELKEAYKNAITRFSSMTWEEIQNIIEHL